MAEGLHAVPLSRWDEQDLILKSSPIDGEPSLPTDPPNKRIQFLYPQKSGNMPLVAKWRVLRGLKCTEGSRHFSLGPVDAKAEVSDDPAAKAEAEAMEEAAVEAEKAEEAAAARRAEAAAEAAAREERESLLDLVEQEEHMLRKMKLELATNSPSSSDATSRVTLLEYVKMKEAAAAQTETDQEPSE